MWSDSGKAFGVGKANGIRKTVMPAALIDTD